MIITKKLTITICSFLMSSILWAAPHATDPEDKEAVLDLFAKSCVHCHSKFLGEDGEPSWAQILKSRKSIMNRVEPVESNKTPMPPTWAKPEWQLTKDERQLIYDVLDAEAG